MDFTFTYQGPLKANGSIKDKQNIRRSFHSQLKVLWTQQPLKGSEEWLKEIPDKGALSLIRKVGNFSFAPLIAEDLHLLAEIDLLLLRPEAPGSIITQGGDIDNRLKTLFDALRMPRVPHEIPSDDTPKEGENPFFCLLEDDNLITKISVETDRLLDSFCDKNHVQLFIRVKTRKITGTWGNISLG